ncbi:hypothetical protein N2152v2_000475 [Parachlorella kessleri]
MKVEQQGAARCMAVMAAAGSWDTQELVAQLTELAAVLDRTAGAAGGCVLRLQCEPRALEEELGDLLPLTVQLHPVHFTHIVHVLHWEGQYRFHAQPGSLFWRNSPTKQERVKGQVCKAAGKIAEALAVAQFQPSSGVAIDIGAAPGSWTAYLAQHMQRVIAIDPAELDPSVASHPSVIHLRCKVEEAVRTGLLASLVGFIDTPVAHGPEGAGDIFAPARAAKDDDSQACVTAAGASDRCQARCCGSECAGLGSAPAGAGEGPGPSVTEQAVAARAAAAAAGGVVSLHPSSDAAGAAAAQEPTQRHNAAAAAAQPAAAAGVLAEADVLVCDMNAHPSEMLRLLADMAGYLRPGGLAVLTLKFFGKGRDKSKWKALLKAELGCLGFHDVKVEWLVANTQHERTCIARRLPADVAQLPEPA